MKISGLELTDSELQKIRDEFIKQIEKLGSYSWIDPLNDNKDPKYPHICRKCKGPAYEGFSFVDCKRKCS